jgi:signal transduction histidine kinase/ligand-binding sensor domain-containing protein
VPQGVVQKHKWPPALAFILMVLLVAACDGQLASPSSNGETLITKAGLTSEPTPTPAGTVSNLSSQLATRTRSRPPQDNDIKFDRISLDQGLSQSVVLSILQDSKGFMWFGTQDGLNRYDGYEFLVYKPDPEDPDSLSGGFVAALLEDSSGALWIGTSGAGLDRFDPETGRFTHFRHDPDDPHSLGSNTVLSLFEDRDGVLWVGTDGGGLNRLLLPAPGPAGGSEAKGSEPGTEAAQSARFSRYTYDPDDPHSLGGNSIQTIYQDREGLLWIGTHSGGLSGLDLETGRFVRYQNDPHDPHSLSSNDVETIIEDRQGVLWLGTTDGGLNEFDRERGQFTHYKSDPGDPYSLRYDTVQAIYEDHEGTLWVGTNGGGLERLERDTGDGQSARFVHYQNDLSDPHSLSNDQVYSIYQDQGGVLWVGTFGGGLSRYDPVGEKFAHYQNDPEDPNSLSSNLVWSLLEDPTGELWIGTLGGGLNRLDRESVSGTGAPQYVHYRHVPTDTHSLSDDTVWSLHRDREGVLWVGTSGGLDRFDPEAEQFSNHPAPPIFTVHEDREGVLWVGTWDGGLGRLDRETGKWAFYQNDPSDPHSLGDDSVISLHEDSEGALWAGTFGAGLSRLDREAGDGQAGRFLRYEHDPADPNSLSHNTILAIHESPEGVLWIATGGGGLNRLDLATETFRHYREKDGLPNDTVYGILEDEEGALWLSTNRGLSRFDPRTETFRNYDVGDGLQSNEFNQGAYSISPGGEMFFGGVNGFNAFYPEEIQDNPHVPPVMLTSLTQGGEPVEAGAAVKSLSEVTFRWPRNFFEFEFAALSYADPEKNEYAYLLEGFDPDWIEIGNRRFGRYTNLPGGTYTLRMKGSNNDGVWNEEGAALKVTVVPPFWRTGWFLGSVALLMLAGVIGGYRLRVRNVEARSHELESQVADRTKELAALNAVAGVVNRSLDLDETLNDALDKTLQVTGIEAGGVYLLDEEARVLNIAAQRGLDPELVENVDRLRVGEGFSGHVVETGQPLIVRDIATDARLTRMSAREGGFHSLAVVPLSSKGKVLGSLFAMTRGFREFSDEEVQLLTSIGNQIGVAVENARLFGAEQRRAEQFWLMNEVGRHITSIMDIDELLQTIIRLIRETLGHDRVSIGLVEGDELVYKAAKGTGWEPLLQHMRLRVGVDGVTGWVASRGEPLLVPDVSQDPRFLPTGVSPPSQSELAVPLKTKEAVIGVLNVESAQLDAFDESDVAVLQSLANQAAIAIENARLLETERQRADELEALRTTMADITSELELPALLEAIVKRAAGLLNATGGEFGLYDEGSQELLIVVSHNLGKDYVGTRHKVGEGAMGRVAETGEPLIIEDYQAWAGGLAEYSHVRAALAAPLKVGRTAQGGQRLVGVFTTVTTDPERRFTPADLHLLNLFAQQAAIAIENARLYEQAQRLAAVEERQRLARDLHDSVTQALYGMALYSEAAVGQLSLGRIDRVAEHLQELQETAQEALTEMRLLIYELRTPVLEEEGLVPALRARLLAVEERAGLKAELQAEMEGRLPPLTEEGLYRIAQEALNNALKHAHARQIRVSLSQDDQLVALEIRDDGIGFDPVTAREGGGVGLSVMEERAADLGGQLTLESEPGAGTTVKVSLKEQGGA